MNLPVMCVLVFAEYVGLIRLMEQSWHWTTLPENVSQKNIETVYGINMIPCEIAACK